MSQIEFESVKLIAKANVYHGGKVISYAFYLPDGSRKTAGIIFPGEYEFGTGDREIMEVTGGALTVLLPGKGEWETFAPGTSFGIPANSAFKCKSDEVSEYVCSYIK
ncbi:MAG: pyrimidine/purine nucleoside phosphorylase [Synergistaceae bacterium]|nr:pyrimidine/purine nucleoside phosphorylase [Synergistaceae bacterium]